jgi:hypothetical protein
MNTLPVMVVPFAGTGGGTSQPQGQVLVTLGGARVTSPLPGARHPASLAAGTALLNPGTSIDEYEYMNIKYFLWAP